ncbi:MAG: A/G-specific adenine glycosylase [Anaerolineales bacterium]|nr:A/G-specific adenine glycosylase [Anaerolineales bacterium]
MSKTDADLRLAPPPRRLQAVARRLLAWYSQHARDLPWRRTRDPYAIWISEIMLQQTQVDTVRPYYLRWLAAFPTLETLATAPQDEVLRLWEGLGYYSRAHNLQRAARQVRERFDGRLPSSMEDLLSLPGIGAYTAAAIASIAFDRDVAVLDGNVKRVLARLFLYEGDVKSPNGMRQLQALADRLLPSGRASEHNQAVMDLGATICTPRRPACDRCPLQTLCEARATGRQEVLPIAQRRAKTPERRADIGVILWNDRVLLEKRSERLLGGLWAFPALNATSLEETASEAALRQKLKALLGRVPGEPKLLLAEIKHTYTHFRLVARAWLYTPQEPVQAAGLGAITDAMAWVRLCDLAGYPMGRVDRRIASALLSQST